MKKKGEKNSNRSFGILFFIIFFIFAIWPTLESNEIRIWSLVLGITFLVLGLINSNFLTPINKLWIKFGDLLGKVIAPIVMGFVYFFVISPLSIIIRLLGKDLLKIKYNKHISSYWISRKKNIGSMKKQF